MECLNRLSLKKAFFLITLLCLAAGALLSILAFWGCYTLRASCAPAESVFVYVQEQPPGFCAAQTAPAQPTDSAASSRAALLDVLGVLLPAVIMSVSLMAANLLFYRCKLRRPITALQNGTQRMLEGDLDFTLQAESEDELGELCAAFEKMRSALLHNSRALWEQAEERRRLNAAFAHDLRNPVAVLKGCVQLLDAELTHEPVSAERLREPAALLRQYTTRLEEYTAAMTRIQKLDSLPFLPQATSAQDLAGQLEAALKLLADGRKDVAFSFSACTEDGSLWMDSNILFDVAENLVSNALRYARTQVRATLCRKKEGLCLTVTDDGPGFPPAILSGGGRPFQRGSAHPEEGHFGLGLALCRLLCEKHGGALILENSGGAMVRAIFRCKET